MKKTALYQKHIDVGAKMVPFAGYEMPVRYGSDKEEHINVRSNVGVFDVSHMGEFLIKGPKALDLIQKVCSNDASKLTIGKVQYSCLPNTTGGIVDDLLVYKLDEQEYMLVVNASNIEKDWNWISSQKEMGAVMENISDDISLVAVQGPNAARVIAKLTDVAIAEMEYYTFRKGRIGQVTDGVIISATGYTGAGGFEIYMYNRFAAEIWDAIFDAGAEYGIQPAGLGARDTLRLEMGYCLYGNDIDESTSPIEAGLGWITKFSKPFVHHQALKAEKEQGPKRKLISFRMVDKGIPRHGYPLQAEDGSPIGQVTSGTMSPSLNCGIGMGYVKSEHAKAGSKVQVEIRGKSLLAEIVKPPLV
jgi:aminomethyltransferase